MDPNRLGLARRPPLASRVLEVADQFLLLRIDRDDGLRRPLEPPHLLVDVPELRVAVRVARAFAGLAVALQTVARRREQFGHQLPADGVAHGLEGLRQMPHALRGPAQRRLGVSRRGRLHQPLEIGQQGWIFRQRLLAATAGPPNPLRGDLAGRGQLLEAAPDGGMRDSCRARHHGDAAAPRRSGLRRSPDPASALRQRWGQGLVLRPTARDVHSASVTTGPSYSSTYCLTLPKTTTRRRVGIE